MERVLAATTIKADPDRLWARIGSFQGIGTWHPMLAVVRGNGETPGAVRRATGRDGSEQVERLIDVDLAQHAYRYVIEATAMPVTDYSSVLRVRGITREASVVEWASAFAVTGAAAAQTVSQVRGFIEAGLRSLEEQYGKA